MVLQSRRLHLTTGAPCGSGCWIKLRLVLGVELEGPGRGLKFGVPGRVCSIWVVECWVCTWLFILLTTMEMLGAEPGFDEELALIKPLRTDLKPSWLLLFWGLKKMLFTSDSRDCVSSSLVDNLVFLEGILGCFSLSLVFLFPGLVWITFSITSISSSEVVSSTVRVLFGVEMWAPKWVEPFGEVN